MGTGATLVVAAAAVNEAIKRDMGRRPSECLIIMIMENNINLIFQELSAAAF
jgi:hypothetical protein